MTSCVVVEIIDNSCVSTIYALGFTFWVLKRYIPHSWQGLGDERRRVFMSCWSAYCRRKPTLCILQHHCTFFISPHPWHLARDGRETGWKPILNPLIPRGKEQCKKISSVFSAHFPNILTMHFYVIRENISHRLGLCVNDHHCININVYESIPIHF